MIKDNLLYQLKRAIRLLTASVATRSVDSLSLTGIPNSILAGGTQVHQRGDLSVNGQNDIYTVPAGKKAVVVSMNHINATGGAISKNMAAKISGSYYRVSSVVSTGSGLTAAIQSTYVFSAGEIISINTTAIGSRYDAVILLLPDTSPLKSIKFISANAGVASSVYQVPAGKVARVIQPATGAAVPFFSWSVAAGGYASNNTGAPLTLVTYLVPNGAAADGTTQLTTASIADANQSSPVCPNLLIALDAIWASSSTNTAGQFYYMTLVEMDA